MVFPRAAAQVFRAVRRAIASGGQADWFESGLQTSHPSSNGSPTNTYVALARVSEDEEVLQLDNVALQPPGCAWLRHAAPGGVHASEKQR